VIAGFGETNSGVAFVGAIDGLGARRACPKVAVVSVKGFSR
jgi:hypothetical protein